MPLRGGGYAAIHKWLTRHYGRADHCEGDFCDEVSRRYHWAKLPELPYEHDRENFTQLCSSCHKLLDLTDEGRKNISEAKRGIPQSSAHRVAISKAMKKVSAKLSVSQKRRYGTL